MKPEFKILLIGLLAVLLLDIFGSIGSRQLNFNYSLLSPVSFLIYGLTAFFATRQKTLKTGILFAAVLGFFDSTIGWKLSILLNANTGMIDQELTTALWIISVVFMTLLAALIGLLGGALASILKKKSSKV